MSRQPKMCRECGEDYHEGSCIRIRLDQGSFAAPTGLDITALETLEHAERVLDVMSTFYRHSPTWKQFKGSECLEKLKKLRVAVMSIDRLT